MKHLLLFPLLALSLAAQSTNTGDWPTYTGDNKGTKYSPLSQIDASNFSKLEVAWRFKTDNLGPRPEYKLEGTPLVVKGVLYTTGGTRRSVVALDAKTGEQLWVYQFREGKRAAIAPRQLSGRGVSYWTDGKGDERIVFVTTGYRLVELNAKIGQPIPGFGKDGMVDLKTGMVTGTGQQIDLENGEAGLHSTALVVKDVLIVGSSFKEGMTVVTHNNTKGLVRAFDARTGKLLWTFNTIPRPGEFGNDTWENGSWATNGNTGVWTQMTVDEDLGLVYLPVESPTSDFYGGERPGDNLFGESLVCVDLKTGKRKWHFQVVHHPIWDYDLSSAPILADIVVDGKPIKAVALPSKEAFLYVFDRVTGKPVWPIEERAVPQSDVPGEKTSADAARSRRSPRRYARNFLDVPNDLIDFTPGHARAGQGRCCALQDSVRCFFRRVGDAKGRSAQCNSATPAAAPTGPARDTIPKRTSSMPRPISPPSPRSLCAYPPAGLHRHSLRPRPGNDAEFRVSERTRLRQSAADAPQAQRRPAARCATTGSARRSSRGRC